LQTAQALAHAHEHKVIHRDLKPENLMLTRDHHGKTSVRVVDFGIAKTLSGNDSLPEAQNLTQTGAIIGSPYYMSPEQGLGRQTDVRSDIYSLGCVMYYALTGRPPFGGGNFVETIFLHVNEPVPPLEDEYRTFPESLQAVVFKALAKEPEHRYQTMDEFADDLERFGCGTAVRASLKPPAQAGSLAANARFVGMFLASFAVFYVLITVAQHFLNL
jgi:serine/threonine-protein kinase